MARSQYFLSFVTQDQDKALVISAELKQFGIDCFDEIRKLSFGAENTKVLASNIKQSLAVILLVNEESLRSQCVRREIEYAIQHGKQVIHILADHSVLSNFRSSWLSEDLKSENPVIYNSEGFRRLYTIVRRISNSQKKSKSSSFEARSKPGFKKMY